MEQSVGGPKRFQVLLKRNSVFNGNEGGNGIFGSGDLMGRRERKPTMCSWEERCGFWVLFYFFDM